MQDSQPFDSDRLEFEQFLPGARNGVIVAALLTGLFYAFNQPLLALIHLGCLVVMTVSLVLILRSKHYDGMWVLYLCTAVDASVLLVVLGPASGWGYYLIVLLGAFPFTFARYIDRPSNTRRIIVVAVLGTVASMVSMVVPPLVPLSEVPTYLLQAGNLAVALLGTVSGTVIHALQIARTQRELEGLRLEIKAARQLGEYTLGEKLGEGGMGVVYMAKHALLRRPAAIKILRVDDMQSPESIARFEREVQLTSELTHPNTISIYDYGHTPDGTFYYVMEYLEGVDLQQLVDDYGPQSASRVIKILDQVCGALQEAHEEGLVHRDIKPANVFLCERGKKPDVVKVLDFGLVQELGNESAIDREETAGTPSYMSPESIVSPSQVDTRSDLYAVGAVGYFLLTGTTLFEGRTPMAVWMAQVDDEPEPPRMRVDQEIPELLEAAILWCLQKSPENRPQSAEELRRHLLALPIPRWNEDEARAWWAQMDVAPRRNGRAHAVEETISDRARRPFRPDLRDRIRRDSPRPR